MTRKFVRVYPITNSERAIIALCSPSGRASAWSNADYHELPTEVQHWVDYHHTDRVIRCKSPLLAAILRGAGWEVTNAG
jgi:hypothetical protein